MTKQVKVIFEHLKVLKYYSFKKTHNCIDTMHTIN